MRDHSIALAAVILLSVLLAGCGAPLKTVYYGCKETTFTNMTSYHFGDIKGKYCKKKDVAPEGRRKNNFEILQRKYAREWNYTGKGRPELGLALSGGGTRSASFCIGVLKALQEDGVLDEVDVISSVSGGSYASYWYFMQNYYLNRRNLGEPKKAKLSPEWDHIMDGEDCLKVCSFTPGGKNQQCRCKTFDDYIVEFGHGKIIFDDLDHCKNALNNTSYPDSYRFQYTLQNASNIMSLEKKPGFKRTLYNGAQYTLDAFSQALSVPVHWIFNGLVFNWYANLNPYRHYYENGIERTYGYVPLSYDLQHFANDDSQWFVRRVDAKKVSFSDMQKYLYDYKFKNHKKLPYFIINATADYASSFQHFDKKKMVRSVYEFTPFGCGSGLTGYVSAENCPADISVGRAISISGAAVDGQNESIDIAGKSEGEIHTVSAVLNIFNVHLGYTIRNQNPDVDAWYYWPAKLIPFPLHLLRDLALGDTLSDIHLSDGGHVENLGIFSLVRRGAKKIIAVDAESDPTSVFSSLNRLKTSLEEEMGLTLEMDWPTAMDVYYTTKAYSIITGRIKGFENEHGKEEDIKLVYIKLSFQKDMLKTTGNACKDAYPFTVVKYAEKHDKFPQESTADIFYSAEQFMAYRDLGYTIAKTCGDRCKKP